MFRKSFTTWVNAANALEYPTTGPRDVERVTEALLHHVKEPETSPLAGKKLAITSSHHCALIPGESEEGDIVAMLAGCYKNAVVRPNESSNTDHLNNLITGAFEQANLSECPKGPIRARFRSVDDDDYDEWMLVWEQAARSFPIQHCSLVGQCNIDEWVPWKRGLPRSGFRVFSLH